MSSCCSLSKTPQFPRPATHSSLLLALGLIFHHPAGPSSTSRKVSSSPRPGQSHFVRSLSRPHLAHGAHGVTLHFLVQLACFLSRWPLHPSGAGTMPVCAPYRAREYHGLQPCQCRQFNSSSQQLEWQLLILLHFLDEKTAAWGIKIICPQSPNEVTKLGFELRL